MVILGVLINAYTICTFATCIDEAWIMSHPRPYPKQSYYLLNWEEVDFYKYKGKWKLREFRETDSPTKKYFRDKYWEKK